VAVLACACLLLAAGGCGAGKREAPPVDDAQRQAVTSFAERFFGALADRDSETLSEVLFKGMPPREHIVLNAAVRPLAGLRSFCIESTDQPAGGTATVTARIVVAGGKTRRVHVGVVRSKGQYYVANVHVTGD